MVHLDGVVNVLVTGAAGFIGSHLVIALRRRGFQVRAFILPTDDEPLLAQENVEIFRGDVTRREDCLKAVRGMDVVFHLAAIVNDWCPRKRIIAVNAGGTESLLRAASLRGVRRFVLVSSLAVHEFRPYQYGDENAPRKARLTAYAESKILAEDIARRYHAVGLIETVIVRPGLFPFGPRDRTSLLKLVRALNKRVYAHINRGRSVFCTAYVENLVEGLVLAGIRRRAAGQTFVIADQQPVSWKSLIDAFCENLGIEKIRRSLPGWLAYALAGIVEFGHKIHVARGEPSITRYRVKVPAQDFYFSSEKARRILGYRPTVSFPEAVKRTIDWYKYEMKHIGSDLRP